MSQTNELGIFMGGSIFHGDVGHGSKYYSISESKPVFGIQFKRNLNYHIGLSLSLHKGELAASDKESSNLFELQRNLHFKSKITELGLMVEFNFRPYLSRDNNYNHTPFIFGGISKFYFNH